MKLVESMGAMLCAELNARENQIELAYTCRIDSFADFRRVRCQVNVEKLFLKIVQDIK